MKSASRDKAHGEHGKSVPHAAAVSKIIGRREKHAEARGDVGQLDPVIHERTRLSILTALFTLREPACSFSDLRDTLALTDGNLMAHLRTLEMAGLLERIKEGAGRNSSTTIQLTVAGRKAFHHYLDGLETLVRAARGK
jgi:DNA-binding MarR family transcriptional regulator